MIEGAEKVPDFIKIELALDLLGLSKEDYLIMTAAVSTTLEGCLKSDESDKNENVQKLKRVYNTMEHFGKKMLREGLK